MALRHVSDQAGVKAIRPPDAARGDMTTLDWNGIDLVVFDVDGTLYDQRRLRLTMLQQLLVHSWQSRSLDTLLTLRTFGRVRETPNHPPGADFLAWQYETTARACGKSPEEVCILTHDWLERRPLPWLAGCRYADVDRLFAGLRSHGKKIAVFSDSPARYKMAALGLTAWPMACATDPAIRRPKPDPKGLLAVLDEAGVSPARALMIGDRMDRDGLAALQVGVQVLIRTRQPLPQVSTFTRYDAAIFQPMLHPLTASVRV